MVALMLHHVASVVVCERCIVVKWHVLEQKLLLTACNKSCVRNQLVPK